MEEPSYPGLPRSWRGEFVHRAEYNEPVAVIGDIHGCGDLLRRLLRRVGSRPVIVVGDLCDRGPDTRGVIDQLVAREAIGVLGNHDLWFAEWLAGHGVDRMALSQMMGGASTLASYGCSAENAVPSHVPDGHRDFLLGLHVALDLHVCGTPYWVVHAGLPSHIPVDGLTLDELVPWFARHRPPTLLWTGTAPDAMVPTGRTLIMGHRPQVEPLDTGDVLAIDTGAGTLEDGRLTAVLLPEREFVSVG